MKKATSLYLLIFLVAFLAAGSGFAYGRYRTLQDLGLQLALFNFSSWATDVKIQVVLLDLLQKQRYGQASARMEKCLDISLASLGPYDHYARKYPDPEVFAALRAARAYREKHPHPGAGEKLAAGIHRAFRMVK